MKKPLVWLGLPVLAGIVLALTQAWPVSETDQTALCAANLRALYVAMGSYAQDNDGYYPPAVNRLSAGHTWLWWFDYLKPYTPDARVFCCPASAKAAEFGVYDPPEPLLPPIGFSPQIVSYGMSIWWDPNVTKGASYRPEMIVAPDTVLLFADAKAYLVSNYRTGYDVTTPHDGALNVCVASGAVLLAKPEYRPDGQYVLRAVGDSRPLKWSPRDLK